MADRDNGLDVLEREHSSTTRATAAIVRPVVAVPPETRNDGATIAEPLGTDSAAPMPRPRVSWVSVVCAFVAVVGAVVALTAPSLRPALVAQTAPWFSGAGVGLADLLTPETPTDRLVTDLLPRVAAIEADIQRLRMEFGRLNQHGIDADARSRQAQRDSMAALGAAQDAIRRSQEITSAAEILSQRVHATTLLAATTRLRRDIDAGTPLAETVVLLDLSGPYPAPVAAAVDVLRHHPDGVASMRDLAVGFEALDQAILAELGQDGSTWWRFRSLFGTRDDPRLSFLDQARALATEGRMAEVATLLTHSPWNEQASAWIGQASRRTDVVRATQVIAAYAVQQARAARPHAADTQTP